MITVEQETGEVRFQIHDIFRNNFKIPHGAHVIGCVDIVARANVLMLI